MNLLKKISNLIFNTKFHVDIEKYHAPHRDKVRLHYFEQAENRGKVL